MSAFQDLIGGFGMLFGDPQAVGFTILAAFVGIVFGALPGLTASAAIAMLLPLSFYLGPLPALAFLYVIGKSGRYGGSIAAILFNTPGTAASAATMQDGHPMAKRGQPNRALRTATLASVFGDYVGEIILIFGAVWIAQYTRTFGPTEYFAIYLMAFVVIGSVVGKSILKGLLSTVLGAMVALIGVDIITNTPRLTFGTQDLRDGMSLVPLLIGVFVISEIIIQAERMAKQVAVDAGIADEHVEDRLTFAEVRGLIPLLFRSSLMGSVIGMMPGLGSSVACFVAYGEEKRRAANREEWGTGVIEGIAAPESANNAVSGPSMIPLLTLGVPGSTVAAVLIGVFLIHGIQVGPLLFSETNMIITDAGDFFSSRELVFALFAAGLLGIAAYGLMGFWGGPLIGKTIARIPPRFLYPFIFLTSVAAAYSARASILDVAIALVFGVVGYLMRRTGFAPAAFVIAFVLARPMEEAFRQALLLSDDGVLIFLREPVAGGFLLVGLLVLILRAIGTNRAARRAAA
ncbi:tripartite tricarboxylate transporter permease [Jannaschia aquimarina]|uniref:Tripartite tricarboxylate transporter TctA family protein n=1 Tax=Jannaschia aquimarina TaxID=935700 RepID=A0A0D1CNE5_9RHOB|nr:tripartite tricarboxylate transporter permease [Jannaschia aquimarina]KIT16262.1 Tripartite tricarboxylate transporter TctA family protein [Jannaschia aquimarina]SNT15031.1 putative tricarboxylic transport membrane protein [Jannaschia aquimarina]